MEIPDFHDGHFDGLWIGPDKRVQFFLRSCDGNSFVLSLAGVERLSVTDFKEGNIIFELAFRGAEAITHSDIAQLFSIGPSTAQVVKLLARPETNASMSWK